MFNDALTKIPSRLREPCWSTRPTLTAEVITTFKRSVRPSVLPHFSKSHKTKQISSENSDRYCRDCGSSQVDHWCLLVFVVVVLKWALEHHSPIMLIEPGRNLINSLQGNNYLFFQLTIRVISMIHSAGSDNNFHECCLFIRTNYKSCQNQNKSSHEYTLSNWL